MRDIGCLVVVMLTAGKWFLVASLWIIGYMVGKWLCDNFGN